MSHPVSARPRVYRITLDAMFVAIFVVLSMVPSQLSWASLPALLCAFLLGPLDVLTVVTIGSFIEQLWYGLSIQTIFWMLPWIAFGIVCGTFAWLYRRAPKIWLLIVGIVCSELLLSVANTSVLIGFGYVMIDPSKFASTTPFWWVTVLTYVLRMPQGIIRAVLSSITLPILLPPLRKVMKKYLDL